MTEREEFVRGLAPYLDLAKREILGAYAKSAHPFIGLELPVGLSHVIPEGKGTVDLAIAHEEEAVVVDLKYGQWKVSALNNSQLRLYGLALIYRKYPLYGFKHCRLVICQPRLDWVEQEILQVDELLQWGRDVVAPTAARAFAGEGEFSAGLHCKFCRARHGCRERARHALDAVRDVFSPAPEIQL